MLLVLKCHAAAWSLRASHLSKALGKGLSLMKLYFSRHAKEKVDERLSLNEEQVLFLLENDYYVTIYEKNGKSHRLFYSEFDSVCFVALVNTKIRQIITILPIDYYNNCNFVVSLERQQQAKKLLFGDAQPVYKVDIFKVRCVLNDPYGKRLQVVNVGGFSSLEYAFKAENLAYCPDARAQMKAALTSKSIFTYGVDCYISALYIQLGKKGKTEIFEW